MFTDCADAKGILCSGLLWTGFFDSARACIADRVPRNALFLAPALLSCSAHCCVICHRDGDDLVSASGTWSYNSSTGLLQHSAGEAGTGTDTAARRTPQKPPQCLSAHPQAGVGGFYGGPKAAITAMGGCPGGKRRPNTSTFEFTAKGEIKVLTWA